MGSHYLYTWEERSDQSILLVNALSRLTWGGRGQGGWGVSKTGGEEKCALEVVASELQQPAQVKKIDWPLPNKFSK